MIKNELKGDSAKVARSRLLTVTSVKRKGHLKHLRLEPTMRYVTVPLSACVSKGDTIRLETHDAWVVCKNGEAQILRPHVAEERIMIGSLRLEVLVKEITEEEEHAAYLSLADFHYRGHAIYGRTARLVVRTFHPLYPKVIGYVELATPFYMNKARAVVLDAPFELGGIRWERWDMRTLRKYIHLLVRISRVVVYPEFRGLGIGQLLIKHAAEFARRRWQTVGYLPYFLEISADMLKYVPFAEKAGMSFVGETEGNLSRVARDMTYLIGRFGSDGTGKAAFEESCGICDQQITRMDRAVRLMERLGISSKELADRLRNLSKEVVLRDFALFHRIVTLPKPHYMKGLNHGASRFLDQRIAKLAPKNAYTPPQINISSITSPICFKDLSISYVSHARRTKMTHAVQQAFNVSPDEICWTVIRELSLTVNPGEILLVVGPSGSGKTTLLDMLGPQGKVQPNIRIEGKVELPSDARVATFQPIRSEKPLIEVLGAKDVSLGLYLMGLAGLSEVFLYLKRFQELSRGQQYRAMLARLIASASNLWVADEFCTNLDPITANAVAYNVQKIARKLGSTVIAGVPHCSNFILSFRPDKVLLLTSTWEHSIISGKEYCNTMNTDPKQDGRPPSLRLLPEFISAVREGSKRATVRVGHKWFRTDFIFLESNREKIAMRLTEVTHKRFCDLTEEDAKADGSENLSALKETLRSIYPTIRIKSPVTIVHFESLCGGVRDAD